MLAIEAEHLTKSYDGTSRALDDLTLQVPEGAVFALLGPNGSGKTTSVRLFNGMLTPTAGRASLFGIPAWDDVPRVHALCGVMTETAHPYEPLTADENLTFFGRLHGLDDAEIRSRADRWLGFFSLAGDRHRPVKTFSTGMRKRLLLAIAVLHAPRLLFLDEPTSGLDPEAARAVNSLIRRLAAEEGVTTFLCTHQLRYAEDICDLFGFIAKGRLLASGTLRELQTRCRDALTLEVRGTGFPPDRAAQVGDDGVLRVPVADDDEAGGLLAGLHAAGAKIYEARQVRMNLEDLYFAVQRESRGG